MKLPSKTRFAFECSSSGIPANRKKHIYLWTFTFADLIPVTEARQLWSKFLKRFGQWNKRNGKVFRGLRVFELHPGGHGLHVHIITSNFAFVNTIRRMWRRHKGGRVHVLPIAENRRNYVAKYLSKSDRPSCFKGVRLWAPFGGMEHTRVKDIQIQSDFSATYRALAVSILGFTRLSWLFRNRATHNVLAGLSWCFGFPQRLLDDLRLPMMGPITFTHEFTSKEAPCLAL